MYQGSLYFNDNINLPNPPAPETLGSTCPNRFICTHLKIFNRTVKEWFTILLLILFPLILCDVAIFVTNATVPQTYAADIDSPNQQLAEATASATQIDTTQNEATTSSVALNVTQAPTPNVPSPKPSPSPLIPSTPKPSSTTTPAPTTPPAPSENPQVATPPPSNFHRPLEAFKKITSYFTGYHPAIDLSATSGTPVYAVLGGKVSHAGWSYEGFGKSVVIETEGNTNIRYAHLSELNVAEGNEVTQGQMVGKVGCTGNCTGPHLHLQVFLNGKFANPLNLLQL